MKAVINDQVIAEGDDIVESGGYAYFPPSVVRVELLEKSPRTISDQACPHGVQFYDVLLDGARHARTAWSYESPRPAMAAVKDRFGFWHDVKVSP